MLPELLPPEKPEYEQFVGMFSELPPICHSPFERLFSIPSLSYGVISLSFLFPPCFPPFLIPRPYRSNFRSFDQPTSHSLLISLERRNNDPADQPCRSKRGTREIQRGGRGRNWGREREGGRTWEEGEGVSDFFVGWLSFEQRRGGFCTKGYCGGRVYHLSI